MKADVSYCLLSTDYWLLIHHSSFRDASAALRQERHGQLNPDPQRYSREVPARAHAPAQARERDRAERYPEQDSREEGGDVLGRQDARDGVAAPAEQEG